MRDEPQNDTASSRGGDSGLLWWFASILFLVLVVYPLSVAPVAKVFGPNHQGFPRAIYTPLRVLAGHWPPLLSFYHWQEKVWGVRL